MKYLIVGLGSFGSSLAEKLTQSGNEVIGIDSKMSKVDAIKEKITHSRCMDCIDQQAVGSLPLKDADVVVICIGEDEGANIMSTALMIKMKVNRLISRALSPLHETVLEAMGVDEIVHPEEETATRWAKKLHFQDVVDSFELTGEYSIVEATVPSMCIGQTLLDVSIRKKYNVLVLNTIKSVESKNHLGVSRWLNQAQCIATSKTLLEENDILVLYGKIADIEKFLKDNK